jgi:hypothetical protein
VANTQEEEPLASTVTMSTRTSIKTKGPSQDHQELLVRAGTKTPKGLRSSGMIWRGKSITKKTLLRRPGMNSMISSNLMNKIITTVLETRLKVQITKPT